MRSAILNHERRFSGSFFKHFMVARRRAGIPAPQKRRILKWHRAWTASNTLNSAFIHGGGAGSQAIARFFCLQVVKKYFTYEKAT
jgi:hypothetical protein